MSLNALLKKLINWMESLNAANSKTKQTTNKTATTDINTSTATSSTLKV